MLDNLKSFLSGEINLPALKNLVDLKGVNLNILGSSGKESPLIKIDKSTKDESVHVTLNVLSTDVKNPEILAAKVGELLADHREKDKRPSLEVEASEKINLLEEGRYYQDEINYFATKVPENDKSIVEAAYHIRGLSEDHKPVRDLIKDIRTNQGTRGANIINLVGRGYFESYLKPMYELLSRNPNFELRMFLENYELIINNAPFAYFVSSTQTVEELVTGLMEKIVFSRQYGQHKLAIHAIGHGNITKVNDALKDAELKLLIEDRIDTEIQRNVMTMFIYYRD